jgi:zinc transporter, ZIP family
MPPTLPSILLFTLVPVLATGAGAAAAIFRPPGPRVRSAMQHFAAGVVFSVVAVELLPDVTRVRDPFEVGWTFAAGVALMLGIEWVGRRVAGPEASAPRGASFGQLVAVGVDVVLDGLLMGIAFAAGTHEGVLLTGALTL